MQQIVCTILDCNYHYCDFFYLISLLMSFFESQLSNKPKQCILKIQKLKCSKLCHYTSCNYRYCDFCDFFDLILLLMSFIESQLSNKPKQCILTIYFFLCYNSTTLLLRCFLILKQSATRSVMGIRHTQRTFTCLCTYSRCTIQSN